MALIVNRLRKRLRQDFGGIAIFKLLEQFHYHVKMPEFVIDKTFPDVLNAWISLVLHATEIVVDLHRFVHHPLLQRRLVWIEQ